MPGPARVTIHPSQFPESVRQTLVNSLRSRQVNHKFHYDSLKQTQKWLALHEAYSPARTDPDCAAIYDHSFQAVVQKLNHGEVELIGLGCGGGQKDTQLLELLLASGCMARYVPCDVSTAMVLVARSAARSVITEEDCFPVVCDLALADDLAGLVDTMTSEHGKPRGTRPLRLFTFFGMIPNFEPAVILPRLAGLVRSGDQLLFSANLAPGPDYAAGVRQILPLYDNELTRDWLMAFLLEFGVEKSDGQMEFVVEDDSAGSGLKRVAAYFQFTQARSARLETEAFEFKEGEKIRLFFSYRHTPAQIRQILKPYGLEVQEQWITNSEEEGVFLVQRS